jgi:hypothetical protein
MPESVGSQEPEDLVNLLAAHVEGGVRPEGWLFVGVNDGPPHQNTVATGGERHCGVSG